MRTNVHLPFIKLSLLIILFLSSCSVNKDYKSEKKTQDGTFFYANEAEDLKEDAPYKVIRSTATVKYTIRKIGTGNSVFFSVNNGFGSLPEITYAQNSGFFYRSGKKEGFEDVSFPFECTLNCPVNSEVNRNPKLALLVNDFEIVIYEPGNWEISFN